MIDLYADFDELVAKNSQHGRQVVLRFPYNPGPMYDDVLIALEKLADHINGEEEARVVDWLRKRGYAVTR